MHVMLHLLYTHMYVHGLMPNQHSKSVYKYWHTIEKKENAGGEMMDEEAKPFPIECGQKIWKDAPFLE